MSNSIVRCRTRTAYIPRPENKPGTGGPLHTQEPVTVASFRTWRGWRECIARDRCLTGHVNTRSRLLAPGSQNLEPRNEGAGTNTEREEPTTKSQEPLFRTLYLSGENADNTPIPMAGNEQ